MEILGLLNLPGWLVGIATFVFTICLYTWYKQSYFKRRGIPTKPTVFFLGDLPLMFKKGFGYIDVDMVRKNGKVFGTYKGNSPTLVINDVEMIKQITVKQFSNFTDRAGLPSLSKQWYSGVNFAKGDHWRFMRTTLSPTFSSGKMKHMVQFLHRCLKDFHEILDEKQSKCTDGFDITHIVRGYTMDVICSTGFGIDVDAQRNPDSPFIKYAREFLEIKIASNPLFLINILFPDLAFLTSWIGFDFASKKTVDFFKKATRNACEERKKTNMKYRDLLQLMINTHKEDHVNDDSSERVSHLSFEEHKKRGLTEEEILINSLIFMIAGYDTTATTINWMIYDLVTNPDLQNKLFKEIDGDLGATLPTYDNVFKLTYLDMFLSETLRMHPVAASLSRKPVTDVMVEGIKIEKGTNCTFCPKVLHFLPEYWPNPTKFDPERFSPENKHNINEYAYMPFGQGPRNCIGQRLALLEVKMTIVSLLQKYQFFKTDQLEIPMPTKTRPLTRPAKPIMVRLEKRQVLG